jgi:bisphosphoglycerate-independent phosphoglycerate mutase (AlkP superfamily)
MKEPVLFRNVQASLGKLGNNAFISGDRKNGSENTVSNSRNISLPAYQSIMAGRTTACRSNSCGRVEFETLQEKIRNELKLKKTDVATIASWEEIANAVELREGQTFVNAGLKEIQEGRLSSATAALNKKQRDEAPAWGGRKDEHTFAQAVNYVKNNKPRFLFISLNDSDEWAHKGNYPQYVSTLKGYDEKIKTLFDTLSSMGAYGQSTTVIVTTDHGRGNGNYWTDHGRGSPESKYFWIYGKNLSKRERIVGAPTEVASNGGGYTHLDIRPTIEKLMGLKPTPCEGCGKVIQELVASQ